MSSAKAQLISKCFRAVLNKKKFRVFNVKILPNSDLCWNGFTHAQLLNIRILVEFCISGIQCPNSFKYLPTAVVLSSTLAILPIFCILMRLPDGDSPCCARVVKSNTKRFTEFINCNFSRKLVELTLLSFQ